LISHIRKFTAPTQMDVGHQKIGRKILDPPQLDGRNMTFDSKRDYHHPRGGYTSQGEAEVEAKTNL
jgi:hypothetical protein